MQKRVCWRFYHIVHFGVDTDIQWNCPLWFSGVLVRMCGKLEPETEHLHDQLVLNVMHPSQQKWQWICWAKVTYNCNFTEEFITEWQNFSEISKKEKIKKKQQQPKQKNHDISYRRGQSAFHFVNIMSCQHDFQDYILITLVRVILSPTLLERI